MLRYISLIFVLDCFSEDSVVIVQSLSHVQLFVTPWMAACHTSLCFTISHSLLNLMSIESVMPSNHLILCHPLLLLPSIFPSIRVFSSKLALCIRWPKYWSFSFSISPSNEYSGLISFRIDWFALFEVQRVFTSTTIEKHQFFCDLPFLWSNSQHPYMTAGKAIVLTIWTSVSKMMSLLFNMLPSFIIAFLLKSKRLLILWLQLSAAMVLEPKKVKSTIVSTFSPSVSHEVMGLDAIILLFCMLSSKPAFSLFSFTFINRLCSFSLLSAIRMVSFMYLRLWIFLLVILIPDCDSPSLALLMMNSAQKLNKQGETYSLNIPLS